MLELIKLWLLGRDRMFSGAMEFELCFLCSVSNSLMRHSIMQCCNHRWLSLPLGISCVCNGQLGWDSGTSSSIQTLREIVLSFSWLEYHAFKLYLELDESRGGGGWFVGVCFASFEQQSTTKTAKSVRLSLNLSVRVLIKHRGREGWQTSHSSLPHVNSSFCESWCFKDLVLCFRLGEHQLLQYCLANGTPAWGFRVCLVLFGFTPFSSQMSEAFWAWRSHLNNLLSSVFGELS